MQGRGGLSGEEQYQHQHQHNKPLPTAVDKRAALWALGHIGSSDIGFEYLERYDIIPYLSQQCYSCTTLSMRGTCFYVMGLLGTSSYGRQQLRSLNWSFSSRHSIAVPSTIQSSFLSIPPTSFTASWANSTQNVFGLQSSAKIRKTEESKGEDVEQQIATSTNTVTSSESLEMILSHISNLCNHVTQKTSLQALRQMRISSVHSAAFTSTTTLFETYKLLCCYSYRLPARRFLFFDLFTSVQFTPETMKKFDEQFQQPFRKQIAN